MKGTLVNTLLCFVGFAKPGDCIERSTWKNRKHTHFDSSLERRINTFQDIQYFAQDLRNDKNFERHLDQILIPRTVGSSGHKAVREYIVSELRKLGWSVEEHKFSDRTPHGDKQFTNIIGTLNPDAPRRMVLACHYDSLIKPKGFLGAIDSAVPCAQMLNIAKTMKEDLELQSRTNDDLTLQLLFFDGEEAFVKWTDDDSIYGSRALAAKWQNELYSRDNVDGRTIERIDIFVLLDLIGTPDTQFFMLERSTEDWYNRMVDIEGSLRSINALKTSAKLFNKRFIAAGISDDHLPFKSRNVPIMHLITAPFPKVWHKMSDNRNALDFNRISDLNKILRVFTAEYLHMHP